MNIFSHILGFPRIGSMRELKISQEKYWNNEINKKKLFEEGKKILKKNWHIQKSKGLDFISIGDFCWYDHVLQTSMMIGNIPERHKNINNRTIDIDTLFKVARGSSSIGDSSDASEMTKWFNTNYHYIVPEFKKNSFFKFSWNQIIEEVDYAINLGFKRIKVILLGPISYLWLGKKVDNNNFSRLELLDKILPIYKYILSELRNRNVDYVQIDEPILVLDLKKKWLNSFIYSYNFLYNENNKILLTTYFGNISHNINTIKNIPVSGIHIDCVSEKYNIKDIEKKIPEDWILSLGVINGRNIWKSNLKKIYKKINCIIKNNIKRKIFLGSSCSLIHVPVDFDLEKNLKKKFSNIFSFAVQKCEELSLLTKCLNNSDINLLNKIIIYDNKVKINTKFNLNIKKKCLYRTSSYDKRYIKQKDNLKLPILPITTIGSFPQTEILRKIRLNFKNKKIDNVTYDNAIKKYIKNVILEQEKLGIDVLVHGEPERNDMVEYFGENLEGFVFTEFGWVQSYGSRCVKPPIIISDVYRKKPITLRWIKYAKSKTNKLVKGMLTGPITILLWSFCREDISKNIISKQIAISLRDEVKDLEKLGIKIIQIDEPAIREGLPLRKKFKKEYLSWAVDAFKLSSSVVKDETQIHTHMCYSEFSDIIDAIIKLDADVITIESSKSSFKILKFFEKNKYPNSIGPGIYDIHNPNIPSKRDLEINIKKCIKKINIKNLWINPDCGLKTRTWKETKLSLKNMVLSVKNIRNKLLKK
ncbi:5-methyltetrahydropteroyltriglutamate--homocysteine S-methyltransferase [Buchnera aphidicola (Ceratoglyphina bambusae)]|uniref:5-methyltetrahydropteroyltriglutamate-- homocysteine S-methyltransferase n=1 Tax=Buchnera aphidicola TaxID=9 RepID=UPI0031B88852